MSSLSCLQNIWDKLGDPGNGGLATVRYDFKSLMSLTLRPNIFALNAVKFYSSRVLFNKSTFTVRLMLLEC